MQINNLHHPLQENNVQKVNVLCVIFIKLPNITSIYYLVFFSSIALHNISVST